MIDPYMIDRSTWFALADRLAEIRCELEKGMQPDVTLAFDANDQARLMPATGHQTGHAVGSAVVPGPAG